MNTTKVLIIDDEMDFAVPLADRLKKRNYDCRAVFSADQALKTFDQNWLPDVAIIDLHMPEQDGLATLEILQSRLPSGKFIMLTGHASTSSNIEGMAKGLSAYLMKPVSIYILIETIETALAEKK
ncbi:MAG: response regulator [Desulfopila sp.]|jgi:DNA-binding NtrC family response regulator|nr:response regulator [Desulfopila sp.]